MPERQSVPELIFGEALRARPRGITTVGLALRIAVASTVSYFLARQVSGSTFVLFAPITTLLVVQASPFATIGASLQRVLGTGLGVLLATIYVQLVPVNALTFFAAVFAALLVARTLPVSLAAQLQIPVAVVFVLALGSGGLQQDLWRVIDVAIGGLVGIVAVYLLPSRPRLEAIEAACEDYRVALQVQLRAIGGEVGSLSVSLSDREKHAFAASSRALREKSRVTRDEYVAAVESLRFHPRARREAIRLEEIGSQVSWLTSLAIQVRALSGASDRMYDHGGDPPALSAAVTRELMDSCADLIGAVDRGDAHAYADSDAIRARIHQALDTIAEGVAVTDVLQSLSLLGRLDFLCESIVRLLGADDGDSDGDSGDDGDSDADQLGTVEGSTDEVARRSGQPRSGSEDR